MISKIGFNQVYNINSKPDYSENQQVKQKYNNAVSFGISVPLGEASDTFLDIIAKNLGDFDESGIFTGISMNTIGRIPGFIAVIKRKFLDVGEFLTANTREVMYAEGRRGCEAAQRILDKLEVDGVLKISAKVGVCPPIHYHIFKQMKDGSYRFVPALTVKGNPDIFEESLKVRSISEYDFVHNCYRRKGGTPTYINLPRESYPINKREEILKELDIGIPRGMVKEVIPKGLPILG